MIPGDLYRAKAADMASRAQADTTRAGGAEYAGFAWAICAWPGRPTGMARRKLFTKRCRRSRNRCRPAVSSTVSWNPSHRGLWREM
jgi:hypothetical protein